MAGAGKQRSCIIGVSGNVGSGKSTLAIALQDNLERVLLDQSSGVSVLVDNEAFLDTAAWKAYCANRRKNAAAFQVVTNHLRMARMYGIRAQTGTPQIHIVERASSVDNRAFADVQHYEIYLCAQHAPGMDRPPEPDVIVRLTTPIDQCMRNIRARARPGEETITMDDLRLLQQHSDRLYTDYRDCPVVELGWNGDGWRAAAPCIARDFARILGFCGA